MPTPIVPSPLSPAPAGGGSQGFATSGAFGVSGEPTTTATSGPWYIEEQTMNINYWRVPRLYFVSGVASLSANDSSYNNTASIMQYFADATYTQRYSTEYFDTSTWQQTQKLEVFAVSADCNGETYGSLNASSMGPAGNVYTTRPYYFRRPWNAATDSEVTQTMAGCSYALATSAGSWVWSEDQNNIAGQLNPFATERNSRGHWLGSWEAHPWPRVAGSYYSIMGAYDITKESLYGVTTFIDEVGTKVGGHGGGLYAIPALRDGDYIYTSEKCDGYEASRHDWS